VVLGYTRRLFAGAYAGKRWGTVTPQYMIGGLSSPDPDPMADSGTINDWVTHASCRSGSASIPQRLA
jgi:hypothetical protein